MKKILLFALLAAWGTSCSDDETYGPAPNPAERIDISAAIADIALSSDVKTRTTISSSGTASWIDSDALGLFCPQAATPAVNVQYTVTGIASTPSWATPTPIYWLDGTTAHKFLAYAPYAAGNNDASAVKIPALNVQNGTLNPSQDFLISNNRNSPGVTRSGTPVSLTFTHAFSLIEFKMQVGAGIVSNSTLTSFVLAGTAAEKLYTNDNASTIALSTGAVTAGAATNTITVTPASSPVLGSTFVSLYVLILPGTYTGPTLSVSFKDGGVTAYTTAANAIGTTIFEAAKKYSYTVTISRTAIAISNPTISDWTVVTGTPISPGI